MQQKLVTMKEENMSPLYTHKLEFWQLLAIQHFDSHV